MLPIAKNLLQGLSFWRTDWKTELSKVLSLGVSVGLFIATCAVFYAINMKEISGVPNAKSVIAVDAATEFGDGFNFPILTDPSSMAQVSREFSLEDHMGFMGKAIDQNTVSLNSERLQVTHFIAHRSTFKLFGTPTVLGQPVTPDNYERGVWISESLWHELSTQTSIKLGSVITVGQQALPILGVIPVVETTLRHSEHTKQLWQFQDIADISDASLGEKSRLFIPKHFVEVTEPTLLDVIFDNMDPGFANFAKNSGKSAVNYEEYRTNLHGNAIDASNAMMVAGFVLLVIGLFNTINLYVTQFIVRLPELSIRKLMGASISRFISERLIESVPVALFSLVISVIVFSSYLEFIPSFIMDSKGSSRMSDFYVNSRLTIIINAGLLIGLVLFVLALLSSILVSGKKYRQHLTGSGKGTSKSGYLIFTRYLMSVQIMVTTLFIFVGGMIASHANAILQQPLGHNIEERYELKLTFNDSVDYEAERSQQNDEEGSKLPSLFETKHYKILQSYAEQIETLLPGIEVINLDDGLLASSFGLSAINATREDGSSYAITSRTYNISPSYLTKSDVVFLAGRDFSEADLVAGENGVIINRNLAIQLFPNQPFDQIIGKPYANESTRKVMGIIENPLLSPADPNGHEGGLVASLAAEVDDTASFVIRVQPGANLTEREVEQRLTGVFSEIESVDFISLQDLHSLYTRKQKLALWSLNLLMLVSAFMAIIGIASLTAVATKQRFFEFGIRMSQGATRANLAWLMTKQSIAMLALGLLGGVGLSLWGYRFLSTHFVEQLPEFDWFILALLLLCSTLLFIASVTVPTRRLLSGNPMRALRTE